MRKKLIIGILISLLFIFLSLKKVDIAELKLILRSADYISLIPIFILVVISMFFRALRWQILIAPIAKVKIRSLFSASSIGLMVNNLLPARIGEIVRAWIIGSRENISKSSVIATVVVERVFDGLTALITLAIVQTFYPFTIPSNLKTALYVLVALCVLIVAYFIYSRNADYSDTNKVDILLKFVPQMARERISSLLVSFREGLKILSNGIDDNYHNTSVAVIRAHRNFNHGFNNNLYNIVLWLDDTLSTWIHRYNSILFRTRISHFQLPERPGDSCINHLPHRYHPFNKYTGDPILSPG